MASVTATSGQTRSGRTASPAPRKAVETTDENAEVNAQQLARPVPQELKVSSKRKSDIVDQVPQRVSQKKVSLTTSVVSLFAHGLCSPVCMVVLVALLMAMFAVILGRHPELVVPGVSSMGILVSSLAEAMPAQVLALAPLAMPIAFLLRVFQCNPVSSSRDSHAQSVAS
eukprot:CAMPEP_0194488116 /NCGR_PEP_ID=MMETSP0253-20130528/8161_1 /TAXON_ID=2966 /ORGANISM="Noctiluca scintillans" /LENGTH=169 /DNA_ID=CAMNT_0039328439 /DNA_START=46 /DNA_END=555 /DNA_ORIENTATION=-